MPKKTRARKVTKPRAAASLVWFEIPAESIDRAKTFYGSLFGWTFNKLPAAIADYWHIDTGGGNGTPDGGLMPRMHPRAAHHQLYRRALGDQGRHKSPEARRDHL